MRHARGAKPASGRPRFGDVGSTREASDGNIRGAKPTVRRFGRTARVRRRVDCVRSDGTRRSAVGSLTRVRHAVKRSEREERICDMQDLHVERSSTLTPTIRRCLAPQAHDATVVHQSGTTWSFDSLCSMASINASYEAAMMSVLAPTVDHRSRPSVNSTWTRMMLAVPESSPSRTRTL